MSTPCDGVGGAYSQDSNDDMVTTPATTITTSTITTTAAGVLAPSVTSVSQNMYIPNVSFSSTTTTGFLAPSLNSASQSMYTPNVFSSSSIMSQQQDLSSFTRNHIASQQARLQTQPLPTYMGPTMAEICHQQAPAAADILQAIQQLVPSLSAALSAPSRLQSQFQTHPTNSMQQSFSGFQQPVSTPQQLHSLFQQPQQQGSVHPNMGYPQPPINSSHYQPDSFQQQFITGSQLFQQQQSNQEIAWLQAQMSSLQDRLAESRTRAQVTLQPPLATDFLQQQLGDRGGQSQSDIIFRGLADFLWPGGAGPTHTLSTGGGSVKSPRVAEWAKLCKCSYASKSSLTNVNLNLYA